MSFDFQPNRLTPFGERAAAAAVAALSDGPMGLFWRRDVARAFQACGFDVDLSAVHTTCAIFASSCWHWAGRQCKARASHIGGPMLGGWLEGLHAPGPYWVARASGQTPEVGDILCHGANIPSIHHVDMVRAVRADGWIQTAHGGGSPTYPELVAAGIADDPAKIHLANGTVARLGDWEPLPPDVIGWFSARAVAQAEHLDASALDVEAKTDPAPPLVPHEIENDPSKAT
jgi:hypothetical protein